MERLTGSNYSSLVEAYSAVYDDGVRSKINEEQEIHEFLQVIDQLVEEGCDLSEYTYDELYESYLNEGWGRSAWNFIKNPETLKRLGIAALANYADEKLFKGGGKRTIGDVLNTNLQTIRGEGVKQSNSASPSENKPKRDSWSSAPESLIKRESTDLFDLIKGHLLDEGYANTEEAALAIMANMSEDWRQSILEADERDENIKSPAHLPRTGTEPMKTPKSYSERMKELKLKGA